MNQNEMRNCVTMWLDGGIIGISGGLLDVDTMGFADIHFDQLTGHKRALLSWTEFLITFRIFAELAKSKGAYVGTFRIHTGFRSQVPMGIVDAVPLLDMEPRHEPSFYILTPKIASVPFPPELHRVPARWREFDQCCPGCALFYEAFRTSEEVVNNEEYATNLIGTF